MTNQTETTVRELNLEDLARVSGAAAKHPDLYAGKHPDGEAGVAYPPGPNLIGPDI